ncbi:MAG: fumarylacetoacetate hydrolase family protein [Acidobacteria bacterium]|nr:fumarylacetoacetate hydrolase family protein [Acidobacteriota bacterium]
MCHELAREDLPTSSLDEIDLLVPIEKQEVWAVGVTYLKSKTARMEESDFSANAYDQVYDAKRPELFFKSMPEKVVPSREPVGIRGDSTWNVPEPEMALVLNSTGSIVGYTIGNDVSARDLQFSDRQWVRGKSCDTFAPCGPFLVTEDELGDPHQLDIELRLSGNLQQSSNTRNLIFDCYTLVSFISQTITLETGDLIFTGTPAGVGVFRDPPVFLKSGDVVEVTIEKIGALRNPVS